MLSNDVRAPSPHLSATTAAQMLDESAPDGRGNEAHPIGTRAAPNARSPMNFDIARYIAARPQCSIVLSETIPGRPKVSCGAMSLELDNVFAPADARERFVRDLSNKLIEVTPSQWAPVTLVALGSGGALDARMIHDQMTSAGYTDIHTVLIDILYSQFNANEESKDEVVKAAASFAEDGARVKTLSTAREFFEHLSADRSLIDRLDKGSTGLISTLPPSGAQAAPHLLPEQARRAGLIQIAGEDHLGLNNVVLAPVLQIRGTTKDMIAKLNKDLSNGHSAYRPDMVKIMFDREGEIAIETGKDVPKRWRSSFEKAIRAIYRSKNAGQMSIDGLREATLEAQRVVDPGKRYTSGAIVKMSYHADMENLIDHLSTGTAGAAVLGALWNGEVIVERIEPPAAEASGSTWMPTLGDGEPPPVLGAVGAVGTLALAATLAQWLGMRGRRRG